MALGAISAKAGGANVYKAMIRVSVWGTIAMGLSALAGYIFGVNI
jgi:VIT1/CCC1 family predicted Fe2+/Mn2+ transporter